MIVTIQDFDILSTVNYFRPLIQMITFLLVTLYLSWYLKLVIVFITSQIISPPTKHNQNKQQQEQQEQQQEQQQLQQLQQLQQQLQRLQLQDDNQLNQEQLPDRQNDNNQGIRRRRDGAIRSEWEFEDILKKFWIIRII